MERWHFKCLFGWEGMREKKWWGLGVFSHPAHPKCFLPKMGRKPGRRGGGELNLSLSKCSCALCTWALFLPFVCFLFSFLAVVLDSFIYLFIFWTLFLPFFFVFFFLYSCFFFSTSLFFGFSCTSQLFFYFLFFMCSSSFGLCYLKKKKKIVVSIHNFLYKKMCYFIYLFNGDIILKEHGEWRFLLSHSWWSPPWM